jgi:hypothetical protein
MGYYGYGFGAVIGQIIGIIIVIVIFVVAIKFFSMRRGAGTKSRMVSDLSLRGKSPEQKKVVKYFLATGCLAAIFRITDNEFDQILTNKVRQYDVYQMALSRLGLDSEQVSEIDPIFLDGYVRTSTLQRIGTDLVARSAEYSLTCLLFSETQLYRYTFVFSLAKGDTWEYSEEYFYKDVTNISVTKNNDEQKYTSGCLGLDLTMVNVVTPSLSIVVPSKSFSCVMREEHEPNVLGMIAKLRDKKQQ